MIQFHGNYLPATCAYGNGVMIELKCSNTVLESQHFFTDSFFNVPFSKKDVLFTFCLITEIHLPHKSIHTSANQNIRVRLHVMHTCHSIPMTD